MRLTTGTVEFTEADATPQDWDEEARTTAWYQAQELAHRDPDAAAYLMAHLEATASSTEAAQPRREHYDPPRLYARIAKYLGFSHRDMDDMHFVTFFSYVREATLIAEEEANASRSSSPDYSVGAAEAQLSSYIPRTRYEGA